MTDPIVTIQQGRSTWQGPQSAIPLHLLAAGWRKGAESAPDTPEGTEAVSWALCAFGGQLEPCPFCGARLEIDPAYQCAVHPDGDCHAAGHVIHDSEWGVSRWNMRAAPAAKVKSLVWQGGDPDYTHADCSFGRYTVINTHHDRGFMLQVADSRTATYTRTMGAAKAAAQADYEARILSALEGGAA